MSKNAAVAAAQRRRAHGSEKEQQHQTNSLVQEQPGKQPATLPGVLEMFSKQIYTLREYQVSNEEHWEASDEFLQEVSTRIDALTAAAQTVAALELRVKTLEEAANQ